MNAADNSVRHRRHRIGWISLLFALAIPGEDATAQIVGERIQAPAARRPGGLSIRESNFSSVTPKSESLYRKEAGSKSFLLESTEGETRTEWNIGGQARPLPEGPAKPDSAVERRVKFLTHEGKNFVKIESTTKGVLGHGEKEVRFSGVYEISPMEGDWAGYESGGTIKVKMLPADHERYLEQALQTFYGPETLAAHSDKFRQLLVGILELKIAKPGDASPAELEALRRIVSSTKTRPETISVAVAPSLTSDPEVFVLQGETMRSTTTGQSMILRFKVDIHSAAPATTPPAKP